ncbi:MAG: phosphoenolpyruvate mutase [Pseudomonas sp.]
MKRSTQFKNLLRSNQLEFICEAHNGLSAKIVEEAGFKGIWASGLSLSAQFGVRDNNEASWTQVLEMLEFMSDATTVPIMLDGDTGYGNFNNMQRLVKKLEQRDIAAVCIEDKIFPKTNSFIGGHQQPLAAIDEFCGKIKAGKDAQRDDDFCVVARVEAFIAGWGLQEALLRAEAYHAAGADAILMHSALSVPTEILEFKREWGDRCPVVIVPTKYYATPTEVYREHNISMVIWANHILRSSLQAMQQVAATIAKEQSLVRVESTIASVAEVFRLQGADALEDAEKVYLPSTVNMPAALVLAASRGSELGELTAERPKAMVQVGRKPLLGHMISEFNRSGIKDISVVRGYRKDSVVLPGLKCIDNDEYDTKGELYTFSKGLAGMGAAANGVIVAYGDVLFRRHIIDVLCETAGDLVMVVDTAWQESVNRDRDADYVQASSAYSRKHHSRPVQLQRVSKRLDQSEIHGEWMGFVKMSAAILPTVREVTAELLAASDQAKMTSLLNALVEQGHTVRVVYLTGHWLDIDTPDDLLDAENF